MTCLESFESKITEMLWGCEGEKEDLGPSGFGAFSSEWGSRESSRPEAGVMVQTEAGLRWLVSLGTVSLVSLGLVRACCPYLSCGEGLESKCCPSGLGLPVAS